MGHKILPHIYTYAGSAHILCNIATYEQCDILYTCILRVRNADWKKLILGLNYYLAGAHILM